jgi:hypothetical protein
VLGVGLPGPGGGMTPTQITTCPCGAPVAGLLVDSCNQPACVAESIRAAAALDRVCED